MTTRSHCFPAAAWLQIYQTAEPHDDLYQLGKALTRTEAVYCGIPSPVSVSMLPLGRITRCRYPAVFALAIVVLSAMPVSAQTSANQITMSWSAATARWWTRITLTAPGAVTVLLVRPGDRLESIYRSQTKAGKPLRAGRYEAASDFSGCPVAPTQFRTAEPGAARIAIVDYYNPVSNPTDPRVKLGSQSSLAVLAEEPAPAGADRLQPTCDASDLSPGEPPVAMIVTSAPLSARVLDSLLGIERVDRHGERLPRYTPGAAESWRDALDRVAGSVHGQVVLSSVAAALPGRELR